MICPICQESGVHTPMVRHESVTAYNNPGEEYGYGENVTVIWLCEECGNEEDYEEE